jgi:hypothetical protein
MFKLLALSVVFSFATGSAAMAKQKGGPVSVDPCPAYSGRTCMKAPEIDPSSAVAGLTLLAGGIAVMLGRRSKRLEVQA